MMDRAPRIVVVGLGYVGLPLAVALAAHFDVLGFDIDGGRIDALRRGEDRTGEVDADSLLGSRLELTHDSATAGGADIYIVTVPTPVDAACQPDLSALRAACSLLGGWIEPQRRPTIVFESTVYPGVTEDVCGPAIEAAGGWKRGRDFRLGYSPERINPGDKVHTVDKITKVVAGEDADVLAQLVAVYGAVNGGNIFAAASIRAAEAAKVIENAQRDINIAFMNEVAQIFAAMDLPMGDVLDAARTKWNFLPFEPGLVGGHCIGVDPYYLAHAARALGHHPQVILAGRDTNDGMGAWVADRIHRARGGAGGRALVLGLTFKENVPDLRNSKVIDLIRRLSALGYQVEVSDPLADPVDAKREYDIDLVDAEEAKPADLVVGAVPHDAYRHADAAWLVDRLSPGGTVADVKGMWRGLDLGPVKRWTL